MGASYLATLEAIIQSFLEAQGTGNLVPLQRQLPNFDGAFLTGTRESPTLSEPDDWKEPGYASDADLAAVSMQAEVWL